MRSIAAFAPVALVFAFAGPSALAQDTEVVASQLNTAVIRVDGMT